jgi:hypothetical protein
MGNDLDLWNTRAALTIPAAATRPDQIVQYAKQLNNREIKQLIDAFKAGDYEMGSLFLWQKTMTGLKKQIGSLGMDFVGELLDREDITTGSSPFQVLSDYDAVRLAEELGILPPTQAFRLRTVLQLIAHFSETSTREEEDEAKQMMPEEAILCLRTCIQGVLGHEKLEVAVEFARFRKELEEKTFTPTDEDILSILGSPYFFRRTTLRVLIALIKRTDGAQLQHVINNTNVLVPGMWGKLVKPDRWLVGRAYAEVHSEGKRTAAAALRKILLGVHGFDYVPEDLRSRTFLLAANELKNVHFSLSNFYNESTALQALASLGTVIPTPALSTCMTAILCVRLGNHWGFSWNAQDKVEQILLSIGDDKWKFYLEDCLPADDVILEKLTDEVIAKRWVETIHNYCINVSSTKNKVLARLLKSTVERKPIQIVTYAEALLNKIKNK